MEKYFQGGQVSLATENVEQATNVFQKFGGQNFGSYHNVYLTTDILLLPRVVEKSKEVT